MASKSNGDRLRSISGTCSPLELVRHVNVSFQGQIFGNVPIIRPVRKIRVMSLNRLRSQDKTWEKLSKPMTQPVRNNSRMVISNDLTAPSTGLYIPMSSRIKLPEMPGKIIAQMAIAPANMTLMLVGSI